jgi:hypothetical protein
MMCQKNCLVFPVCRFRKLVKCKTLLDWISSHGNTHEAWNELRVYFPNLKIIQTPQSSIPENSVIKAFTTYESSNTL